MAIRAVSLDAGASFLWALHAFLQVSINIGHFPAIVGIGTLALSIVTGVVIGAIAPLRQLRVIDKKGEARISLSTVLIVIGATFVAISVLLASNLSIDVLRLLLVFISPLPSIVLALRAFLFSRWEKKHGKWILTSFWVNNYYVQPKSDQPF